MAINPDQINNTIYYTGDITFGRAPTFPAGAISNAAISATAAIDYSKIVGQHSKDFELYTEDLTIVSLAAKTAHITRGTSGTNISLQAFHMTLPTSANCTTTIELMKVAAGSSAWATVLSTPILLTTTSVKFTAYSATFASTGVAMAAGELWKLNVVQAGTTAGAGKGLHVTWNFSEAPA